MVIAETDNIITTIPAIPQSTADFPLLILVGSPWAVTNKIPAYIKEKITMLTTIGHKILKIALRIFTTLISRWGFGAIIGKSAAAKTVKGSNNAIVDINENAVFLHCFKNEKVLNIFNRINNSFYRICRKISQ